MADRADFHFADRIAAGRTEMTTAENHVLRRGGMAGWILNATVAGRGSVGLGTDRYRSRIGDLLLFAPTAVHDYRRAPAIGHWVHLWVYFYPRDHWQPWLQWFQVAPGILRLRLDAAPWDEIIALFERLVAVVQARQPMATELGMCLLEQILIRCRQVRGADERPLDPRIAHAVEWLAARYALVRTFAATTSRCATARRCATSSACASIGRASTW